MVMPVSVRIGTLVYVFVEVVGIMIEIAPTNGRGPRRARTSGGTLLSSVLNSCLLSSLVPRERSALARLGELPASYCHVRTRLDSSCDRSHSKCATDQVWHRNDQVEVVDSERRRPSGEGVDVVGGASPAKVE